MILRKKNRLTKVIFFTPDVQRIRNSLLLRCLNMKIISEMRKERGINFGIIPKIFKIEYLKYVFTGYPLSTINSKKLTDLTVRAIKDKPNSMIKNVLSISIEKF